MRQRNANIELYRCLLTLGIVILHVIGFYGGGRIRLSSAFVWCVPGFIFITGYFGCRFSVKKVLRIYGVALWCFCVTALVGLMTKGEPFTLLSWLKLMWGYFLGNWFVHAYVGLMMFAPLVDAGLDFVMGKEMITKGSPVRRAASVFGPFLVFVFGWTFLRNFNYTHSVVPDSQTGGVVTLLGGYVFARLIRVLELESKISNWLAGLLLCVGVALSFLKIGQFNSVVALMITVGSFVLVHRLTLPKCVGRICLWLAPSMFSVFLYHCVSWSLQSMPRWCDMIRMRGIPLYLSFFLVAGAVFAVGVVLDIPRRFLVRIVRLLLSLKRGMSGRFLLGAYAR